MLRDHQHTFPDIAPVSTGSVLATLTAYKKSQNHHAIAQRNGAAAVKIRAGQESAQSPLGSGLKVPEDS